MSVSSYLELYLAIFGWYMYDEIWTIFVDTGIAFLPFIGMMIKNVVEPIKSQEAKDAAGSSLRRIEVDIFSMLTVIVLAAQPTMTLNFAGLSYTRACAGTSVTAGSTGTSYDSTFTATTLGGGTAKVPLWWFGVLALSGGVNNAIIIKIPCNTDIRFLKYGLKNSRVKSPQLRRQVQDFYNDCFAPSMSTHLNKNLSYPSTLDVDDIHWIGSKYLVDTIYATKRSKKEIPGFAYDSNRDLEHDPAIYTPTYGKPTCKQWWTGTGGTTGSGLRDALKGEIDAGLMTKLQTEFVNTANSIATAASLPAVINTAGVENMALRTLINNEEYQFKGLKRLNEYNSTGFSPSNIYNNLASSAGSLLESGSFYPKMYLVKMAAPVIQAMILMMVYLFLPFILLFSSYRIGTMIFMSIVIFSIKFWTVLWAISHWLDSNLMTSLQPTSWFQVFGNSNLSEMVINFTTATMYIVMPLFWSSSLAWAGYKIGNGISDAIKSSNEPSQSAGKKGGDRATKKLR